MVWFKVDDSFVGHPKAAGISNDSLATWTRAGNWCAWQLTDGAMRRAQLSMFTGDADDPGKVVADLLGRNLWEETDEGWQFHDWTDYNPTRAEVLAKRKTDADRRRRYLDRLRDADSGRVTSTRDSTRDGTRDPTRDPTRDGTRDGTRDPTRDDSVGHSVGHGVGHTTPTRPDPTIGRVVVGEGDTGSDRNPREGWTPHAALDPPPAPKRGGGPRTTHADVQHVIEDAHRPGGPSEDPAAQAAAVREAFAARPRPLTPAGDPGPARELTGEALAAAQLAESRAARLPDITPAPADEPDWTGDADTPADDDLGPPAEPPADGDYPF